MNSIDLNCDMGESFGAWEMGNDAALMPLVTSVNIACGFHAGDPHVIAKTVRLAIRQGVAIGAHPSYPDLLGFGRREMNLDPSEIYDCVSYQIAALKGICEMNGGDLHHVKPHGALYNRAARDRETAAAIAKAVRDMGKGLILCGLSGSNMIGEAESLGLKTASEVFADRTYCDDGTLTPRSSEGALITDPDVAVRQVLRMISNGDVTAVSGKTVPIRAETVCIHGDAPQALEFAKVIRSGLAANGVGVKAVT